MSRVLEEDSASRSTATHVKGIRLQFPGLKSEVVEDAVALESPINLFINHEHFLTLFATPFQLEELALGHLVGEGIIENPSQIRSIKLDGTDVLLSIKKKGLAERLEESEHIKMIISSCGSVDDYMKVLDKIRKPRVKSDYSIQASGIASLYRELNKESGSFKRSIAVHSAGLGVDGRLLHTVEDVSRHVSVDKIIGLGLLRGVNFSRSILLTTGRQASDMILKSARVGIPITMSLRGPLFSGIYSAQRTGITLVSVTRGKGITVYTHPERIKLET